MPLSADQVFAIANMIALGGWLVLAAGVAMNNALLRDTLAGWVWPTLLSVAYVAVIGGALTGAFGRSAGGDFNSLKGVMTLFSAPWAVTGGWIHYLAFDLFVGTRITQEAARDGVPRLWLIPVLPLTFLFGPAGLLLFNLIRPIARKR